LVHLLGAEAASMIWWVPSPTPTLNYSSKLVIRSCCAVSSACGSTLFVHWWRQKAYPAFFFLFLAVKSDIGLISLYISSSRPVNYILEYSCGEDIVRYDEHQSEKGKNWRWKWNEGFIPFWSWSLPM
jgi:hypothetical protein